MFHFVYKAKNEKFSILFDVNNDSLEFCYWHQYMGHSNLDEKHAFKAKRKEAFSLIVITISLVCMKVFSAVLL